MNINKNRKIISDIRKISKVQLISYIGMLALLASLVLSLMGLSNYTRDIDQIKNQLLNSHMENNINLVMKYIRTYYGTLSPGKETLLDTFGKSIEGRYEVVDNILEDLGDRSTIFVKVNDDFKRISTNIMTDNNERAVGTFLGADHKAYQTVMKGDLYIGEVVILSKNYYAAYEPLKDQNRNVIGLLFVGIPTEMLDNIISVHGTEMSAINIWIIVLRTISLGALIVLASSSRTYPKFHGKNNHKSADS